VKLLREYIGELLTEMAYIDQYPPEYNEGPLADPRVAAHYHADAARLKKKRSSPPRNWKKVLSVLQAGGYIIPPMYGKSYRLVDVNDKTLGKIQSKTIDELSQSGFLEDKDERDPESWLVLSDEGRGYL